MSEIRFDKLSMHDRVAEPVSLGVPFAVGQLMDPGEFGILNGGRAVPVQTDVTACWEDGSVKWLMAHFLADLPGNAPHRLATVHDGSAGGAVPANVVTVVEKAEGVEIDTGPLQVVCAREGFDLFRQAVLGGTEIIAPGVCSGFGLTDGGGREFTTSSSTVDAIEVVQNGPIRVSVLFSGTHCGESGKLFDYRATVSAWAGKPWVEVEYQFINRESVAEVMLSEIALTLRPSASGSVQCALGEGHYQTGITRGPAERVLDQETILYQAVEHVLEVFYGDFWVDWRDGEGGVAVTIHQAHQNFPKALKVDESGIRVGLYPAGQSPVGILQGVAKTHRMMFHFHGADTPLEEVSTRSLQYQYPDVGILPEAWYRDSGVWENLFPESRCQRLEARIIDSADRRGQGLGMLHWGDGPDSGYTDQGRGKGDIVWTNNEYDFPHAMFLLFARTGERRFRDAGLVAAQHWMDVDFCHHSDNPLKMGGQLIHTARHVTGSVTPSHEWTEGLLDTYHLTGKAEALEKAVSIADNMLRHIQSPKFSEVGGYAARETGWAMRGLIAVHDETRDEKYLSACREIAGKFLEWKASWGAFLAPYTSHTKVRVPFMISIAVNALYRYYRATGDARIPDLIAEEMQDLVDHCVMPDGRFFYKELPSLHRRAGGQREMEALCHAYELSGNRDFLDQVHRMLVMMLDRGLGGGGRGGKYASGDAVIFGGSGPKGFAAFYVPFMEVYRTLSEEGLLEGMEYKSRAQGAGRKGGKAKSRGKKAKSKERRAKGKGKGGKPKSRKREKAGKVKAK